MSYLNQSDLFSTSRYSPVKFSSTPIKESGIAERYTIIVKKIIDFFDKSQLAQNRGTAICQAIESIKSKALDNKEKGESLYPEELTGYCNKLKILVSIFEDCINYYKEAKKQLEALDKLCKDNEPIFCSWNSHQFCVFIDSLLDRSEQEYAIKLKVLENIAHSETKADLVMHSLIWEYPQSIEIYIKSLSSECLRTMSN